MYAPAEQRSPFIDAVTRRVEPQAPLDARMGFVDGDLDELREEELSEHGDLEGSEHLPGPLTFPRSASEPSTSELEGLDDELEVELGLVEEFLAERYAAAQGGAETVTFPSGAALAVVPEDASLGYEHADPDGPPLLDIMPVNRSLSLSPSFTAGELARSGAVTFDHARIDPELVRSLQMLRDHLGQPLHVTSGYRAEQFDSELYQLHGLPPGASAHSRGLAADVRADGVTGADLARAAAEACGDAVAIKRGPGFVHLEIRREAIEPEHEVPPRAGPRDALLNTMTADMTDMSPGLRARLLVALQAFTPQQVKQMVRVGVRFWGPTGEPPALQGVVKPPEISGATRGGARASYIPGARFVRLLPDASIGHIAHELAHAWDNMRSASPTPLSVVLKSKDPVTAMLMESRRTGDIWWSAATTKHAVGGSKPRMTVEEMLDAFRKRNVLRDQQFGTPGTRPGYAATNAREFYAEAFAVFHCGDDEQRQRLREQAPEIHHLLKGG